MKNLLTFTLCASIFTSFCAIASSEVKNKPSDPIAYFLELYRKGQDLDTVKAALETEFLTSFSSIVNLRTERRTSLAEVALRKKDVNLFTFLMRNGLLVTIPNEEEQKSLKQIVEESSLEDFKNILSQELYRRQIMSALRTELKNPARDTLDQRLQAEIFQNDVARELIQKWREKYEALAKPQPTFLDKAVLALQPHKTQIALGVGGLVSLYLAVKYMPSAYRTLSNSLLVITFKDMLTRSLENSATGTHVGDQVLPQILNGGSTIGATELVPNMLNGGVTTGGLEVVPTL